MITQESPKKHFYFVDLLRAFAAILITNAHYTGIYPSDIIANGGLLGDVIFFSVSGFCLASPRLSFGKWYAKRLLRIYAVVWIATLVFVLFGAYQVDNAVDAVKWFVHPTKYHFVASITLLYIPLYYVAKFVELNKRNYFLATLGLLAIQLLLYFTVYDKSYYHIDTVREPMIEFLFFQSMLLGLYFREQCSKGLLNTEKSSWVGQYIYIIWISLAVMLVIYFASKMLFVNRASLVKMQLLNQIILFVALYFLFRCTYTLEDRLKGISESRLWKVVVFLSDHTLEIYCVQYVIIAWVQGMALPFPINWLLLTTLILVAATILRWLSQKVIKLVKI